MTRLPPPPTKFITLPNAERVNSYRDRRSLSQKCLNFFFNNIIVLTLKRPKKCRIFQNSQQFSSCCLYNIAFSADFNITIHCSLSLESVDQTHHVYRRSKFVVTLKKWSRVRRGGFQGVLPQHLTTGGGLGKGSRTVRALFAGPYLRVGNRHSDVGNRLQERLGLVGKV